MISELLNVSKAAAVIGCSEGRVRQMLRNGELEGKKYNERAWLITEEEAQRMAEVEHSRGRPRKSQNRS